MESWNRESSRYPGSSRVPALTPWGSRDSRDGFLDSPLLSQTEKLFQSTSHEGINFSNYNNISVEVSEDFPVLQDFKDCEVSACLLENLLRFGYNVPTPVQRYAIPISILRKDLMAGAQTGSGKTVAYLYPLIAKMLQDGPPPASAVYSSRPLAMVLAPTRELAVQIHQESLKLVYKTGIISICAYGGTPVEAQASAIQRGIDILVGTPGRIIDLVERRYLDMSIVRYLVLDEADRMLDMGFEPQLVRILEFIKKKERETVMCSATFPSQIQRIAKKYLREFVFLSVGRVGSTSENIVQQLHLVNYREKLNFLINSLRSMTGKILSK